MRFPNWPMPRIMNNHGNFVGSLGGLTRWLGAARKTSGWKFTQGSPRPNFFLATTARLAHGFRRRAAADRIIPTCEAGVGSNSPLFGSETRLDSGEGETGGRRFCGAPSRFREQEEARESDKPIEAPDAGGRVVRYEHRSWGHAGARRRFGR